MYQGSDLETTLIDSEEVLYIPDDDEIASLLSNTGKGEKQPDTYRDLPYAVVFMLHLSLVAFIAIEYGKPVVNAKSISNGSDIESFKGLILAALITAFVAFALSIMLIVALIAYPKRIMKTSIYFSLITSGICLLIGLISRSIPLIASCSFYLFVTGCYCYMVRTRIPFASANLETAATAVKSNLGLATVALLAEITAILFTSLWGLALVGAMYETTDCDENMSCQGNPSYAAILGLLLSLFWTSEVMTSMVHVTVAGTISTWWFAPEDVTSCCSAAVTNSLYRATTFSFGSICFGSLLVAFFKALRSFVTLLKNHRDSCCHRGLCLYNCVVDCLLCLFEAFIEYFNQWVFIYVGIYGYTFLDAGRSVMELFRSRGWEIIITDDLVSNMLTIMAGVVALITGTGGLLLERLFPSWFEIFEERSVIAAFILCFIVSLVISSIVFGVINSAVYTVIVCFAEAPAEFNENHQDLSDEMKRAWMDVYPDYFRYY